MAITEILEIMEITETVNNHHTITVNIVDLIMVPVEADTIVVDVVVNEDIGITAVGMIGDRKIQISRERAIFVICS